MIEGGVCGLEYESSRKNGCLIERQSTNGLKKESQATTVLGVYGHFTY